MARLWRSCVRPTAKCNWHFRRARFSIAAADIWITCASHPRVRKSHSSSTQSMAMIAAGSRLWMKRAIHRQLTQEFATTQGLAWSPKGDEIWFTASEAGADRQVYSVSMAGKMRAVLTNPLGTRILDVAPDGRVLLLNERQQTDISGIDPATGKERRGLEWFDGSLVNDITPDGKAITRLG